MGTNKKQLEATIIELNEVIENLKTDADAVLLEENTALKAQVESLIADGGGSDDGLLEKIADLEAENQDLKAASAV